jgi:hypothetical protein
MNNILNLFTIWYIVDLEEIETLGNHFQNFLWHFLYSFLENSVLNCTAYF